MIVTLTANPSLDRTVEVGVGQITRGEVIRADGSHVDAGGKGVNVTRALAANGHASIAVLPCGGADGAQLLALLEAQNLDLRAVPIAGAIRSNITVAEHDGTTTKINEPGPLLSAAELSELTSTLLEVAVGARWAVLSGSLPPGAPTDLYAKLTEQLHAIGVKVAVDSSGQVLAAALAAEPDLIKPNDEELAEVTGLAVETLADVLAAIAVVRERGAQTVVASLGAEGAVLVDENGNYHASAATKSAPRSTVGAGDSLLAGFLSKGGAGPEALIEGVAWGTAAVCLPGSRMPQESDIDRAAVRISTINTGGVLA